MMARGGWVTSGGSLRLGGSRLPFRHLLGAEVIGVVKEDVGWVVARRCLYCLFPAKNLQGGKEGPVAIAIAIVGVARGER